MNASVLFFLLTFVFDAHHRQVVELFGLADELIDSLPYIEGKLFWRFVRRRVECLKQSVHAKQFVVFVGSFRDAVGI